MVNRDVGAPQGETAEALIFCHRTTADSSSTETQASGQNSKIEKQTENGVTFRESSNCRTIEPSSESDLGNSEDTNTTVTGQRWVTFDEDISPESTRSTSGPSTAIVNGTSNNISRHDTQHHVSFTDGGDEHVEPSPDITADHLPCRTATCSNVSYHTYCEGEECRESEVSLNLSSESSRSRRRRRGNSLRALLSSWRPGEEKRGVAVTDSFVNECICCCTIS